MNIKMKVLSVVGFFFGSIALSAPVNARQDRQKNRIQKGVESGELTRYERRNLRRGQKKIRHTEKRMRKDGKLNRKERRKLDRMQDKQSKKIYRKKHNERDRDDFDDYSERSEKSSVRYKKRKKHKRMKIRERRQDKYSDYHPESEEMYKSKSKYYYPSKSIRRAPVANDKAAVIEKKEVEEIRETVSDKSSEMDDWD